MAQIKYITNELREWIVNTLNNGTSPVLVADALVKKGFSPRYAYESLFEIVGSLNGGKQENPFQYETPEIGLKGSLIKTSDRNIKVLSRVEKPFILHLDNVLSEEECDELILLAKDRLQPSRIVDPYTGEEKVARGRTSKGMYFAIQENAFIKKLEQRFMELTAHPIENGEGLQVLNYSIGEEYKAHYDYFPSRKVDPAKGGQRIGTLLLYLNDVDEGGETVFPNMGISIVPKKGTAVYFHYGNSQGQVDPLSLHSSIPIEKGEKSVATKWIRESAIY